MAHPQLRILDMPHTDDVEALQRGPRALKPVTYATAPCAACTAVCCRGATVELTTVEALRVAYGAYLGLQAVTQRMGVGNLRPRLASIPIPLADGPMVHRLRHGVLGGCTFLTQVMDQTRCGIHALRPGLCRFYPFHFQVGRAKLQVGDGSLCPSSWMQTEQMRSQLAQDHKRWKKDMALERRLVRAWVDASGANGTWPQFTAFALQWGQQELGYAMPFVLHNPGRKLGPRLW